MEDVTGELVGELVGEVVDVPYVPNYGETCASSSMTMMLKGYDSSITFDDVLNKAGLPPIINYDAVDEWIREEFDLTLEMYIYRRIDDILTCIDEGYPVMVLQVFSAQVHTGHNRVVIGYNLKKETLIVHDPSPLGPDYEMSFEYFDQLWKKWDKIGDWNVTHFLWLIMPVDAADPI